MNMILFSAFELNIFANLALLKKLQPMLQSHAASVIFVSAGLVRLPIPNTMPYTMYVKSLKEKINCMN